MGIRPVIILNKDYYDNHLYEGPRLIRKYQLRETIIFGNSEGKKLHWYCIRIDEKEVTFLCMRALSMGTYEDAVKYVSEDIWNDLGITQKMIVNDFGVSSNEKPPLFGLLSLEDYYYNKAFINGPVYYKDKESVSWWLEKKSPESTKAKAVMSNDTIINSKAFFRNGRALPRNVKQVMGIRPIVIIKF